MFKCIVNFKQFFESFKKVILLSVTLSAISLKPTRKIAKQHATMYTVPSFFELQLVIIYSHEDSSDAIERDR